MNAKQVTDNDLDLIIGRLAAELPKILRPQFADRRRSRFPWVLSRPGRASLE